ncbi:MAG TPA: Hsp20/alpha crystallin family protein [Acidimicrobiales bacterium]|nr:Hsp20/alpha crystallin family protein [Acidimicrobiales bacterium]
MALLAKRETPAVGPAGSLDVFGGVDRAFERMFDRWPTFLPLGWPVATTTHWLTKGYIPVNEFYQDGSLVIRAEIPGIDPEKDVELTVTGGMLHIKAERREEEKVEEEHYLRREIHRGSFERTLTLPEGVTEADVTATYKDGILEIVVPKAEIEPAKKIAISKS